MEASIWKIIRDLGIANFAVSIAMFFFLGGDAQHGYIRDSHYFLGYKGHYVEVSEWLFAFSRWQMYSMYCTFVAAFIAQFRMRCLQGQHGTPSA